MITKATLLQIFDAADLLTCDGVKVYDTMPGGEAFDPFDDSRINRNTIAVLELLSDDVFEYNRNHEGKTPMNYHTRDRVDMNFCDDDTVVRLHLGNPTLIGINTSRGHKPLLVCHVLFCAIISQLLYLMYH